MFLDRRRSYIFAILTFPNEKPSSFKNYKSRSIFYQIPQQTDRSTSQLPKQVNHVIKNNNYLLINHDQFLIKYVNRLTDQPLSKHYRVKLDLDGLRKARYPRITKTATKRLSVLSLCCDQRQDHL